MKRHVNKILPVQTAFVGKRLSIGFKTKDSTKFERQHDIIYNVKISAENFSDDYTGESGRRTIERVKDHGGTDTKSHVLGHSSEK